MKKTYLFTTVLIATAFLQSLHAQQTWTETSLPTNAYWYGIACSADGSKMVTEDSGGSYGIWTSTNSGVNWKQANAPINANWVCSAISADGTKMMVVDNGGNQGIWISTNSGVNWTNTSAPINNWYSIACSADGSKWAAVENKGVYTSTDSGTTWTQQINAPDSSNWRGICSSADGTKLTAVFNDNPYFGIPNLGIVVSTNSGVTWKQANAPTNANWQIVACTPDGVKQVAVGNADLLYWVSTNSGTTWVEQNNHDDNAFSVAISANGTRLITVGYSGIYASTDGGINWTQQTNQPDAGAQWQSVASSADGGIAAAVNYGGGVYVTRTNISPRLNVASANDNLTVSWIVPSQAYTLEEKTNLTASTWVGVTNAPFLNLTNLQNQVTVLKSSVHNGFYRLQSQ